MKSLTVQYSWAGLLLLAIAANGPAHAQTAPGPGPQSSPSIEQDLLTRLKGQPIGQGTLESLDVPEVFLRRVADRIIRMDYQKRYRMVLRGDAAPSEPAGDSGKTSATGSSPTSSSAPVRRRTVFGIAGGGLILVIALVARRRRREGRT
ncbi:MAG TPA: hypothetical protein VJZ71_04795 [Phycisphaerae bacterium]|nr:hypothetical protein [Phycisphaerae bacterium]